MGRRLPEPVWEDRVLQEKADDYLREKVGMEREAAWEILQEEAERLMQLLNKGKEIGKAEALEGVKAGVSGVEGIAAEITSGVGQEEGEIEPGSFVKPVTAAMVQAMSEFFAGLAHQYPGVVEFRDKVHPDGFLTPDEARALVASCAARTFPPALFEGWGIPFVGHRAEILDHAPYGEKFNPVDHWMTIRVDPPGITETVRYAYTLEGDKKNTWYISQRGAVAPIITDLPAGKHGEHECPPWLWPGSVVDKLFDLSLELGNAFDWPVRDMDKLGRARNEAAAWFILTGEAPEVHPIDARWKTRQGSLSLNPQWRVQLTIPPWLSEKEVLQAYRLMRRQIPGGRKLPKKSTTLEVARFVWEQERRDGYEKRSWDSLREQWNEEHPGHRFETYNEFYKYFTRGAKTVQKLNFSSPQYEGIIVSEG